MQEKRELAEKYCPVFWLDENEPFELKALGYTVFAQDMRSDSFPKRHIQADWSVTEAVIEYAVWFDYDIQHLYELEHVWVHVGTDGSVQKVEGSFHGKYLNEAVLDTGGVVPDRGGRPEVYLQPGKHAVLPDPRVIRLVPQWKECCGEYAGSEGVTVPEMFDGQFAQPDEATQGMVRRYIREHYAFEPAMRFWLFEPDASLLMPWEELKESIPQRVMREIIRIREADR